MRLKQTYVIPFEMGKNRLGGIFSGILIQYTISILHIHKINIHV